MVQAGRVVWTRTQCEDGHDQQSRTPGPHAPPDHTAWPTDHWPPQQQRQIALSKISAHLKKDLFIFVYFSYCIFVTVWMKSFLLKRTLHVSPSICIYSFYFTYYCSDYLIMELKRNCDPQNVLLYFSYFYFNCINIQNSMLTRTLSWYKKLPVHRQKKKIDNRNVYLFFDDDWSTVWG